MANMVFYILYAVRLCSWDDRLWWSCQDVGRCFRFSGFHHADWLVFCPLERNAWTNFLTRWFCFSLYHNCARLLHCVHLSDPIHVVSSYPFLRSDLMLIIQIRRIHQLGAKSRFSPKLYYIVFIICDIVSLVLQAVGGAMSSNSKGSSQNGVDISLAGLSFQVFSLTIFIALSVDYARSYLRDARSGAVQNRLTESRYKVFLLFLALATLCIYTRCVYRIAELSDGYSGPLIEQQGSFIGLEGV